MSEPTTTLRFPDRIHTRAKIAATERGLSLQELVAQAVEAFIGTPAKPVDPGTSVLARRIANLPRRSQDIADRFVAVLETAPDFYLRAIEQYVTGMQAVFRRVDLRNFERMNENSRGKGKRSAR